MDDRRVQAGEERGEVRRRPAREEGAQLLGSQEAVDDRPAAGPGADGGDPVVVEGLGGGEDEIGVRCAVVGEGVHGDVGDVVGVDEGHRPLRAAVRMVPYRRMPSAWV
ncbi:hypothetical protein [Streptomyces sp. LRa12]|uniref:hypothetical protein n=1 Tax=Streptomyces sp. LRa12 TaxID=2563107 RepID=UPI001445E571